MNPLLDSFVNETRDLLETAGSSFLALENDSGNAEALNEIFRAVHTIKGASGLFEIEPFTRLVHAAEDVLEHVRCGELELLAEHVDMLLDALDRVSAWIDELESNGELGADAAGISQGMSSQLRQLLVPAGVLEDSTSVVELAAHRAARDWVDQVPETTRARLYVSGGPLVAVRYQPDEGCFFQGHDPLHTVCNLPGLEWFGVSTREPLGELQTLDPYRCVLDFEALVALEPDQAREHLRYVIDECVIESLDPQDLVQPAGPVLEGVELQDRIANAAALVDAGDWPGLQTLVQSILPGLDE
ncbi:MAG: Hpt domain-containing protein, partial [Gammaproteobacteria bacterium]|nr:Hpt domain-containing protein [Gammaproteobacteria bacterium]